MQCLACEGTGWRVHMRPHPGIPGHSVPFTCVCTFCQGKGEVKEILAPSGKDFSANDGGEKELLFSS